MKHKQNMDLTEFNEWKCEVRKNVYQFGQLCSLISDGYDRKHGGIVLDPDYQREYKFGKKKESSIIESLLLNIPIPVIYLSKDTEQEKVLLNVIDGAHRLKAMYRFKNNEFALTELTKLKSLNGQKFDQLPPNVKNRLEMDSQINVESIDVSNNEELEYEVFMRFNQATNPLTRQELNEVVYRSKFSLWIKDTLIQNLSKMCKFKKMFKYNDTRKKDKTINYDLYACLGYSYSGLVEGKNDTPYYVERFMKDMKNLSEEKLELKKVEIENYLKGFLDFYNKISIEEEIENIFSKEFVTQITPKGNHKFLISFLIPLTLSYDYLILKVFFERDKLIEADYHLAYKAIVRGMNSSKFIDFGGVSSTSYRFQKKCIDYIKESIDQMIRRDTMK
ncbi:DUF262 domain-containing protein [Clostridium gasigenes]|uniref:DUF262 domain-containing protein n=1 Tax=Clostridium gasigenes TaxID=94869 RepID=UPI0014385DD1|nr:DUF262 domain-containing protein [Clostridium gasigenes]NKF08728.1 DUF262 domain-containing protein [Clostridium gasigenes]QSW19985.1 DUF262 domain-containing protein [Clostridium gasigenes]